MQICITGANGFIGRHLVEALLRQGYILRVLTRRVDCVFPVGVHVVQGDLTLEDVNLEPFLSGCDVLLHCAGEVNRVEMMRSLHVDGTQRLLQAVQNESSKRGKKIHWVQLSSIGAYGPAPDGFENLDRVVTEETPCRPINEYEITKTISDDLVMSAVTDGLITYSVVRPSKVLGRHMVEPSLYKLIRIVDKKLFFYIGKPGAVATYVHVDDVVAALVKCSLNPVAKGRIYNVSSDCLLEELIEQIALTLGARPPWLRLPEGLTRQVVGWLDGRIPMPLSQARINGLVNRTRYATDRIVSELDFVFSKPMPQAIDELVREYHGKLDR
ncbi:MAG: NAD-dependent epimerase/dehydratase family protein [Magnetococcus sp. YQC-5]